MKFRFKNLGVIREAELELGDMTIVCGRNNTGKTYVAYATFGFLDYWHDSVSIALPEGLIDSVMAKGVALVSIEALLKDHKKILNRTAKNYSRIIDRVLSGNKKLFEGAGISVSADARENLVSNGNGKDEVDFRAGSAKKSLLEVKRTADGESIQISLLVNQGDEDIPPPPLIERMAGVAIKNIAFKGQLPRPFVSSAERTGAAMFQKELDFTRNRIVDLLKDRNSKISPLHLLGRFSAEYPVPVRENVDFIRDLPNIVERESFLLQKHPRVLQRFKDIVGGEYTVSEFGHIQFTPANQKGVKLEMTESSSAVRSLLDLAFYLRHIARPGDLLIVDEPELNLHPENQRLLARLFATLVNHGIKVFMTTHSDYIVKELNTLLRLNRPGDKRLAAVAKREGYDNSELLAVRQLKVYMTQESPARAGGRRNGAKRYTLVNADIDAEMGIDAASFDETIDDINRIEDEIIWG